MFFIILIDSKGIPGKLIPVSTVEEGYDRLMALAAENGVEVTRDVVSEDQGFFVEPNSNHDATGFWLVMPEQS